MLIGANAMSHVWDKFRADEIKLQREAGTYGDQWVIERLAPQATILQEVMPSGFFHGYRNLTDERPKAASVVVFAGSHKPHNTDVQWVKEEWTA
jgi:hypothetical protein